MDDIKLAMLGNRDAAKRLTDAGVLVPCAGCGGENAKHMTLEQLREMDAGEEKVRQILIERNLRLVVYIARRFENTGINIDDLISIGTIGLIKAISTYKSERNIKLATYVGRCIENEILMFLRKNSSQRNEVSLDEPLNTDWDGKELLLSDVLGTEPGTPAHRF